MSGFFRPPPSRPTDQADGGDAPPWTGRPEGAPLGEVLSELVLARSERGTLSIAYLDAYPEGFELEITATTTVAYDDLGREGDDAGPDVFGRRWPTVRERSDGLPSQLLRVGVQFADGRTATNIVGYDRPVQGPIVRPLTGGGRGGGPESHFHQGYWISPLPPSGPVIVVCEWPAVGISLVRQEIAAQLILDAAERAQMMFPSDKVVRDGQEWRLGTEADVAWINDGTSTGMEITAAIPPIFASYCTLLLPPNRDDELATHKQAVIDLLTEHATEQSWWLAYLDTGASDVVFPYAPRTTIYSGWGYVVVDAGPQEARTWRDADFKGALPDLMFPKDRSWLFSTLWDDDWTCIGGSEQLVSSFLAHPVLGPRARCVALGEDATPPGHEAR
jgi:hypothetical protein